MREEGFKRLQERAIAHANVRGYQHLAEDFAQALALSRLESRGSAQNIAHAFIDFLRVEYGRVGTAAGSARSNASRDWTTLTEWEEPAAPDTEELYFACERLCRLRSVVARNLSVQERAVYRAYFLQDLTLTEAGDALGMTRDRVFADLQVIKGKLMRGMRGWAHPPSLFTD